MSPREYANKITPFLSKEEIEQKVVEVVEKVGEGVFYPVYSLSDVEILTQQLEDFDLRLKKLEDQMEELKCLRSQ
jgi:hypothetical protein